MSILKHGTKIQWTQAPGYKGETWNPTVGCSKVSPGCANCYAIKDQHRMAGNPNQKIRDRASGLTKKTPHGLEWTGKINFIEERLQQPLRWRKPRMVFVNSQSDLFHESVTDEQLDQIFAVMASTPQHIYQVLTKRPERMLKYLDWCERRHNSKGKPISFCRVDAVEECMADFTHAVIDKWPLPNVWLGVTCENQKTADERIPLLLQTPAAVRFLSCEPLLEKIDACSLMQNYVPNWNEKGDPGCSQIDQVIIGGESGPKARICDDDWIRSLLEQCKAADVPAFVKQLGSRPLIRCRTPEDSGWEEHGPIYRTTGKGGDPTEWPEELQVREWPRALTTAGGKA